MTPPIMEIMSLLSRYRSQTISVGGLKAMERFDADKEVRAVKGWLEVMQKSRRKRGTG